MESLYSVNSLWIFQPSGIATKGIDRHRWLL